MQCIKDLQEKYEAIVANRPMKTTDFIKQHEGLELKPYKDTVGKLSIGYGRNLDDNGITKDEAEHLFGNDIATSKRELSSVFEWFDFLSEDRQTALISVHFNLGLTKLLNFEKMIKAFENQDYEEASKQLLDSKRARQLKRRSEEEAELIRVG